LFRIGTQSLWLDELVTMRVAQQPFGTTWSIATGRELHTGLYHLATWPWVRAFGDSEAALRSLSVVFGVATLLVLMALAKTLFGVRAALFVAPLFLVQAQTIHYFQEARTYTLAMLAACIATLALLWALDEAASTRRWLVYGLVAGAAAYGHLFVGFVLVAHVVALVLCRAWPSRQAVLAAGAAAMAVTAPLLVFMTQGNANIDWVPDTTFLEVRETATTIALGGGPVVALVPLVLLWVWRLRQARPGTRDRLALTVVVAWLAVPFVAAIAASVVKPMFVTHYLNVCVPAAALLTAAALDALARRSNAWALAALTAVLVFTGLQLAHWYDGDPAKEDFRSAMAYACTEAHGDAAVVFSPLFLEYANYYSAPECGAATQGSTEPDRLVVVVRAGTPLPSVEGWVTTASQPFDGLDVLSLTHVTE
jgi:4-amino-4-deoxy-L-arabinose transferase-like glycosyltransferase